MTALYLFAAILLVAFALEFSPRIGAMLLVVVVLSMLLVARQKGVI